MSEVRTVQEAIRAVLARLNQFKLLLLTDKQLPSVVETIVGSPVAGSWWGHPAGHLIYSTCCELEDHPQVLLVPKLLSDKSTFVHQDLWMPIVSIGLSKSAWQMEDLAPESRELLGVIQERGEFIASKSDAAAAKDLEKRLLIWSKSVHTEKGFHVRALCSRKRVMSDRELTQELLDPATAQHRFDSILTKLNAEFHCSAKFPWSAPKRRKKS